MKLKQVCKVAAIATTLTLLAGCTSVNTSQPTNALVGRVDSSVKAECNGG